MGRLHIQLQPPKRHSTLHHLTGSQLAGATGKSAVQDCSRSKQRACHNVCVWGGGCHKFPPPPPHTHTRTPRTGSDTCLTCHYVAVRVVTQRSTGVPAHSWCAPYRLGHPSCCAGLWTRLAQHTNPTYHRDMHSACCIAGATLPRHPPHSIIPTGSFVISLVGAEYHCLVSVS
jgi:hypothetical protein